MSPEANKPENKDLISTEKHPEGVRPFGADLADVHDRLALPDDASTIDPITGNVEFDRLPETVPLSHDETETLSQLTSQDKSKLRQWTARLVGGAIIAGGGFGVAHALGGDESSAGPESQRGNVSAPTNSAEKIDKSEQTLRPESIGDALIANLNKKPTNEQIEYVIANPVNISTSETVGEAVSALGDRWNVMANSGEVDLNRSTSDNIVFTDEDEARFRAMGETIFDQSGPNFTTMLDSLRPRRGQIGAMFNLQSDAETEVNFEATTNADTKLTPNSSVELDVNTIWTTNLPDNQTADGLYNHDYSSEMTLAVDATGRVYISAANNSSDLGDIG